MKYKVLSALSGGKTVKPTAPRSNDPRAFDAMPRVPGELCTILGKRAAEQGVTVADLAGELVAASFAQGVGALEPGRFRHAGATTIRVRLSPEVREKINVAATAAGRSVSMECRLRLECMVVARSDFARVDLVKLEEDLQRVCRSHGIRPSQLNKIMLNNN